MGSVEDPIPPAGGYSAQSSAGDAHDTDNSLRVHLRPNLVRRDTDFILSYYQSEHAGRPYAHYEQEPPPLLKRQSSQESLSGSEYSAESFRDIDDTDICDTYTEPEEPTPVLHVTEHSRTHQRRPSVPSPKSADRRRLAIVELDSSIPPSVSRKGSGHGQVPGVSSSSLLSRRGLHVNGLALVAPPDASPTSYTNLTPPPTAPLVSSALAHAASVHAHTRSASDTVGSSRAHLRHQSSRDIGIVGTSAIPPVAEMSLPSTPSNESYRSYMDAPIFQTPGKSRSSTPAVHTPDLSYSTAATYGDSFFATPMSNTANPILTPIIGEAKDVRQPVVGPVIVNLDSDHIMRHPGYPVSAANGDTTALEQPRSAEESTPSLSYLSYQAGVHSTAGPLPPPPMSILEPAKPSAAAPPRPPRLRTPLLPQVPTPPGSTKPNLEVLKESLQLPPSVSAKLGSRPPSRPEMRRRSTDASEYSAHSQESGSKESKLSEHAVEARRTHSVHKREGAFAPSTPFANTTPATSPDVDKHDAPPVPHPPLGNSPLVSNLPVVEPESDVDFETTQRPALDLRRESSWVSLHETGVLSSPNGKAQRLPEKHSPSPSPDRRLSPLPPAPPPKTGRGFGVEEVRTPSSGSSSSNPFKATLSNLKRFSALPRTPSSLSVKSLSKTGSSTPKTSREPSPAPPITPKTSPRSRVINPNPPALIGRDVLTLKFASERANAYAEKIRELSMCDPGLSAWIVATQARVSTREKTPRKQAETSIPPEFGARTQPWHVASASVDSEVTFPRRADAYQATDLTMRADEEILPISPPSSLPYPSLVTSPPSASPMSLPAASPTTRTYQVPLSGGPSSHKSGFLASFGRRASLKKAGISPPSPPRMLKKLTQTSPPPPPPARPIQLHSAPTVRGGPRAPPNRLSRSKTVSASPPEVHPQFSPQQAPPVALTRSETRSSYRTSRSAARRPSLLHRSAVAPPPVVSGPEFDRQLEELAALLPHADTDVLAGYLRRAGENILAIGQYLEDEKHGTLRYD
ncbi:hypothetical protein PsYK624_007940 [Phanerochaete sordida]|uniref:Uncharacterized protein n=1 Tax=Phanerochaete sordida TaxID=48140 RepID=A0A9P3L882_9APHY|nr:hypothetical protein PsYK624_007940 [Phanerochaete sordida]